MEGHYTIIYVFFIKMPTVTKQSLEVLAYDSGDKQCVSDLVILD